MPMTELQTECSRQEQINLFLANRLHPASRPALVAHLKVCEPCASLLRDLREDERLAALPLTAEEWRQIRAIVREARVEVSAGLDRERWSRKLATAPTFDPPALPLPSPAWSRVWWLSAAAALVLAALAAIWLTGGSF